MKRVLMSRLSLIISFSHTSSTSPIFIRLLPPAAWSSTDAYTTVLRFKGHPRQGRAIPFKWKIDLLTTPLVKWSWGKMTTLFFPRRTLRPRRP
ncbi:hypothetical protein GGS20DRAFT_312486 [Poronia punctata]|nr:hypothetical protein GGS20DRAFT_312486 [Poronia punctata]